MSSYKKSHTGSVMTLRRGDGYTYSSKKNMNMRISTEAELVIVDDNMLQVI